MEYYSSSYYNPDLSEYHQTPYYSDSNFSQQQFFAAESSYNYNDYECYDQTSSYYAASESDYYTRAAIGYSVSSFTEPNMYFALDPAQARFIVSHSVAESNDLDFVEYDPTPYGGGFDLIDAYGKALPPSKETCYPHSSIDPKPKPKTVSFADPPTQNPEIDKPAEKSQDGSKIALPIAVSSVDVQEKTGDSGIEQEKNVVPQNPGIERENRVAEIAGIEGGNKGIQVPYGYGLEAMDLCESLFGYWPCLAKAKREFEGGYGGGGGGDEEWKGSEAADYLFGGSDPYGGGGGWENGGSYQNVMYGYERHCQEQDECVYMQVEYER